MHTRKFLLHLDPPNLIKNRVFRVEKSYGCCTYAVTQDICRPVFTWGIHSRNPWLVFTGFLFFTGALKIEKNRCLLWMQIGVT